MQGDILNLPYRGPGRFNTYRPESRGRQDPSNPRSNEHNNTQSRGYNNSQTWMFSPFTELSMPPPRYPPHAHPQQYNHMHSTPQNMPRFSAPAPYAGSRGPEVFVDVNRQLRYLSELASHQLPLVEISQEEVDSKEAFRKELETICQNCGLDTLILKGFGSLASGFGLAGSDMDLAIVSTVEHIPESDAALNEIEFIENRLGRRFEKALLERNIGARLLTKTRVSILKICQKPTVELFYALCGERRKWEAVAHEEEVYGLPDEERLQLGPDSLYHQFVPPAPVDEVSEAISKLSVDDEVSEPQGSKSSSPEILKSTILSDSTTTVDDDHEKQPPQEKKSKWKREKKQGPLDFPKDGVGIQCDINFDNPLGIHNTELMRCYSLCDPRVRRMILFIKAWAKTRKVNSSYAGTLSSYGWGLMVLHYLINIANPPVLPNLQLLWKPPQPQSHGSPLQNIIVCCGYPVRFWRDADEISEAARAGHLTTNSVSLGELLRGFFYYFANPDRPFGKNAQPQNYTPPPMVPRLPTFHWARDVLALRVQGGIRTKADKGWTGATTTFVHDKEVRQRYLFAIEDPFEVDHNVARTVTHFGIVAIRDELRRAWRIIDAVGKRETPEGGLFDEIVEGS